MPKDVIRLLLVDDEAELVAYLSKRFAARGIDVAGVTSGAAAIALAQQRIFDMAVVDLKMPEMGGIEVMQRLKQLQPFLQVLVLTGHGTLDTALQSGWSRAYRYLEKPFDFDKLQALLHKAYDVKRQELRHQYEVERDALIAQVGISPREILDGIAELTRKYEQRGSGAEEQGTDEED